MAFPVEGSWSSIGVCVRQVKGAIEAQVFGSDDPDTVTQQTARILSLDVEGRGFAEIGKRDPVVAETQARHPGLMLGPSTRPVPLPARCPRSSSSHTGAIPSS
jgi:DNA-3-methyladenine glycosylase II